MPGAAAAASVDSDALWAVGGRGYEAWVCELAHALLLRAADPVLRMCDQRITHCRTVTPLKQAKAHCFADTSTMNASRCFCCLVQSHSCQRMGFVLCCSRL